MPINHWTVLLALVMCYTTLRLVKSLPGLKKLSLKWWGLEIEASDPPKGIE